jgi:hypothetical protein
MQQDGSSAPSQGLSLILETLEVYNRLLLKE